ncbi:alpha/beta hydrolase [Pseudomonas sp. LS1212]|uniref:alpha/beta fold hydrolase n=1 Tax=Pseudomonas sp. LS1212 TaxID=2972478 RepID=UPI00215CDAC9|nr:alpha/beta hydrolase [Pseudomonas sp. LS1212]UVJ46193.1 alpha/beta hydrolase [Pseudomonas sp. LS1212]
MKVIHNALGRIPATVLLALFVGWFSSGAFANTLEWPARTTYQYQDVDGQKIFYREAGDRSKPTLLLLHGFPSSSHTYRALIPLLSGSFHVIAPDYLGSGYSDRPDPNQMTYSFDLLAKHVAGLVEKLKIDRYTLYMQDFGAPVGYRLMLAQPERLQGLIVQNANAYLSGLTPTRLEFFRKMHEDRSPEQVAKLYSYVSREFIINGQYLRDVKGKEFLMNPDSWTHDLVFLQAANDQKIQVQLFQDYWSNIEAYPQWQEFLRLQQPPTLIVWGKHDPAFISPGAEAYLKDLPNAELHLIDAGHFAAEEQPVEIAKHIHGFMARLVSQ